MLRASAFVMVNELGSGTALPYRRQLLRRAQAGLYWTGAAGLYARLRRCQPPCILMYHSVTRPADEAWIAPRNRMAADRFEMQMRFLAKNRRVISLADLTDMLWDGKSIPPKTVLLTFDDGYRDNLEVVAPILERYQLPATLYLCTGYVDRGDNQWADVLYSALRRRRRDRFVLDGQPPFDLAESEGREAACKVVADLLLSAGCAEREALLESLVSQLESDTDAPRLTLNWDEVRSLAAQYPNFALGVHTADHVDLSSLAVEEALDQIRRSADDFEGALGRRPVYFSFPYSRSVPRVCQRLSGLGFRSAMTREGIASVANDDPFDLHRMEAPTRRGLLGYYTSGAHPGLSMKLFRRA